MRWLDKLRLRLRSLVKPAREDRLLDQEFQFHCDQQIDENLNAGMSPQDARRAAIESLGTAVKWKEECREMRQANLAADFLQDLRYGMRAFRKYPLFTAIAVFTLALGIGANTAIYSFIDAALFRPPLAQKPATLVSLFTLNENERRGSTSYPDFLALAGVSQRLENWAAHTRAPLVWTSGQKTEIIWGVVATGGYFKAFGIQPQAGRTFGSAEASANVVVIGNQFWRNRLKADPRVLGSALNLAGRVYNIIGIMPDGFRGSSPTFTPAIWIPLDSWTGISKEELNQPGRSFLEISARLANGVSASAARAEMLTLSARLDPIADRPQAHRRITVLTYREARLSADRTFALIATILTMVVGIVLLIASSNVASLLVTRTLTRRKEIALRQSIGASRLRIVRQLLTESALLGLTGAAVGAILAAWALKLLAAYQIPSPVPITFDVHLDTNAAIYAAAIGIGTSLLFGLMPAFEAARTDLAGRIRGQQSRRGQEFLVALQVTGGVVLISGAFLFLAALKRAESVPPGFTPEHALTMTFDPGLHGYTQAQTELLYRVLLERTRSIPGVRAAALAQNIPLGNGITTTTVRLPEGTSDTSFNSRYNVVAGDYFPAMGTRLVRGRGFTSSDTGFSPPVAVINEFLAAKLFSNGDALGKRICQAVRTGSCSEIIGIAEQGKYGTLAEDPVPYFWLASSQRFSSQMILVLRTDGAPEGYVDAVRSAVNDTAGNMPILEIKTLREHMRIPLLEPQLPSFFLTVLSAIGLLLSLAGIFGVTAYAVTSRTKEIGIRMAIGASRSSVVAALLGRSLKVVGVAICLGLTISVGCGQLVSSLLYGLNPGDPLRLGAVGLLMLVTMLAGALWPARNALRVDPAITLRDQ